jgi:Tfp pilus assembly protein PilZ
MDLATASHPAHDARLAHFSAVRRDHAPLSSRNRRRHARVQGRGVAGHLQSEFVSVAGVAVENISLGGLFVRSATALEVGTRVKLQLVRPGLKRAIQVSGRVVSVVTPEAARAHGAVAGMRIGFDPLDAEGERRLAALIDDLGGASIARPAPRAPEPPPAPRAPEPVVAPPAAAAPVPAPVPALSASFLELCEARGTIEEQSRRLAEMESELKVLRAELLRRNRTIGDLAKRLSCYEDV